MVFKLSVSHDFRDPFQPNSYYTVSCEGPGAPHSIDILFHKLLLLFAILPWLETWAVFILFCWMWFCLTPFSLNSMPMDVCLFLFLGSLLLISACWRTFVVPAAHLMEGFCHRRRKGIWFGTYRKPPWLQGFQPSPTCKSSINTTWQLRRKKHSWVRDSRNKWQNQISKALRYWKCLLWFE